MRLACHRRKGILALGLLLPIFLLGLLAAPPAARAADTDIVITEIMQNPAVLSDTVGEWFEVHNTGPDPVDLQGWTLQDLGSDSYTIPLGTARVVPAGGYAVLARDSLTMVGEGVPVLLQYSSFLLANSADEIILLNASSAEIDRVEYTGVAPWPAPNGASMQWIESTADNNVGSNWAAPSTPTFGSGDAGTPAAANATGGGQAPTIANVIHRPLVVESVDSPTVTAEVTDADGDLDTVTLYYRVDGSGFATLAMSLTTGDTYAANIPSQLLGSVVEYYVEATDLTALSRTSPLTAPAALYGYTVQTEVVTPIADIHADSLGYAGTLVTVQGQVYIPGDYKADGVSVSAYIQDGSDRGLNIYGDFLSTGMDLLNDTSNIVKVSGTVEWYFTTVEIVNYEVQLVSTGNPALSPLVLATGTAALPQYEGTYIGSTGPITAIATTGGTNPAHNFTIDDGSGPLVIRIDDDLVVGMDTWALGDVLVASGAGATFGSDGQILVGSGAEIVNQGPGDDIFPPELLSAVISGPSEVTVNFSEDVDAVTGGTAGNYEVYESLNPGNTVSVTGATVQGDATQVVLSLGAALNTGVLYTLRVNNVEDLAGNVIATDSTTPIIDPSASVDLVITEVMQNPAVLLDDVGEWFEVHNRAASPVDINGWSISDLGTDNHVIANGGPLVIQPGEYVVLARNAAAMSGEGVTVLYEYGTDISLGNGADELILKDSGGVVIDEIAWDGGPVWPDPTGASMQWNETGDNNDGTLWYFEGPPFGSGDLGTPGAVNQQATDAPGLARRTVLRQNVPNPFNPRTSFSFSLEQRERVSLRVFDSRGRLVTTVLDEELAAGDYDRAFFWDGKDSRGRNVTSGVYYYRLETASGYQDARKMTLVR